VVLVRQRGDAGQVLPSRNSRLAPPPVEMWVILSATPALWSAATESPPPTMVMASSLAATQLGDGVGARWRRARARRRPWGRSRRWCGVGDLGGEELDGLGADVERHHLGGEGAGAGEDLGLGVGGELVGEARGRRAAGT
jgi:hypothetical protein